MLDPTKLTKFSKPPEKDHDRLRISFNVDKPNKDQIKAAWGVLAQELRARGQSAADVLGYSESEFGYRYRPAIVLYVRERGDPVDTP